MKFGDYLRQKREDHGLTQPEAAARANIEQSYLSKLETGKSYPSEEVFGKLMQAYQFSINEIGTEVSSDDLNRLKEISDVREMLLKARKNKTRFMRSWLIAGMIMVMISGALLGLTSAGSERYVTHFQYRSEGIIKDGESPMIFSFLEVGQPDKEGKTLADRVDYQYQTVTEFKGQSFIEKVDGGFRKYTLFETDKRSVPSSLDWLLGPAFMFLLGGLACFYISRRWR